MTRLETFISQLDGLIVFLAAAHKEVFKTIREHEQAWFPQSQNPALPDTFATYRISISNAAFLLGYAYFEAFLADIARDIYRRRRTMLPKEKEIKFKEVLACDSITAIVEMMIEKEIRAIFYSSIEDIQKYFKERFDVAWRNDDLPSIVVASRMRNCLMHNGGLVDERLAEVWNRQAGSPIQLTPDEVHKFGIRARAFAREIWRDANSRHLQEKE